MLNSSLTRPLRRASIFGCMLCALTLTALTARADNPRVVMTVADRGAITIELFAKDAPKTTAHFLALANKKFYDGILFHRVIKGFVAQAGDPASKKVDGSKLRDMSDQDVAMQYHLGGGGSGENIPFEENHQVNDQYALAMALSGPRTATGDSQFFINLVPNHRLDGDYCVFGKVVKGTDVVDKIQQGDKITSIRPVAGTGKSTKKK
jgi:cyclophilin family peptidyl-prolyl cis-trans isomerase